MKIKLLQKLKSALLLSGLCLSGTVTQAQVYTFTNAGATGVNGPTQLQVTNAYASTSLANSVTVTGGIQSWTVPVSGTYKVEVYGANGYGVYGGKGAYMSGEFSFNANDVLQILVGQMGGCCNGAGTNQYGGGGGSFVVGAGNNPLIIAGGGGGGATFYSNVNLATAHNPVADADISTSGKSATGGTNGAGGTAGNGGAVGNTGGGGGGFFTDGGSSTVALAQGGKSFLNGGAGASGATALGGFGGGGGVSGQNNMRAGGGGGYSGGGGCGSSTTVPQIGGGGGSYNTGSNQINTAGLGTGHGMVVITLYGPCTFPPTAGSATATPNNNICGGANISLNLTGNSTGQGQTYQWEESLTQGGNFTPISGATSASSTIQATSSMYYRCVVTCNGFTATSSEAYVSVGPVSGTASTTLAAVCVGGSTTLSLTGYTGNNIQWESFDNITSTWSPITGATTASYNATNIAASTIYRAEVTCNFPAGTAYSNSLNVSVTNPQLLQTFPGSRCNAGPVTLAATGSPGSVINWYAAASGGPVLSTGGAFTTPSIAVTTDYYAAASSGGQTQTSAMPPTLPNVSTTTYAGLVINVTQALVLNSVNVFSINGGTVSVELRNSAGVIIAGPTVFPLVASTYTTPQNLLLNFVIPPGNGYRLLATPSAALAYQGGSYPLPLGNNVGSIVNGAVGSGTSTSTLNYYFYNLQTTSGCESPRVAVQAAINGTGSGSGLSTGGTTIVNSHPISTAVDYTDACNDRVATVSNNPAALGNTAAIVLTSPTVQTFGNKPYVPRAFDITPTTNGSATVTLYALQSDFTAYNNYVTTNNLGLPLLPTTPASPNVANVKITQYHGNALAGTSGPLGMYNAQNSSFITNVTTTWTGQYWAMTFPVTGFSGFFIHTGATPLVVDLRDISAVNVGSRNRIDWSTVSEEKGDIFELERSANGENFSKLAVISAKGSPSTYSYWDETPIGGPNYYRLKLVHTSGTASYSKVVAAIVRRPSAFSVEAYPNPVSDKLTLKAYGSAGSNATATIADITGKVVMVLSMMNNEAIIDMSGIARGMYLIKYNDTVHSQTLKINKQ